MSIQASIRWELRPLPGPVPGVPVLVDDSMLFGVVVLKRARITVCGVVQGVGFRAHTQAEAIALGLRGYVRNLASGAVEIVAEGDEARIERLIEWARTGPPSAAVDDVQVEFLASLDEFSGFTVR